MKTKIILLGSAASLLGSMGSAHAVINIVEHQTFNDNTTPASYTEVGTPTYAGGALVLDGNSGLTFTAGTPLGATDNFGIEAIVTLSQLDNFDFILANSTGVTNGGYGLLQDAGWQAIVMGQALSTGDPVIVDTEVRLAFVRDEGFGALYVNGAFFSALSNTPATPTQLNVGFNPFDFNGSGQGGFTGSVNEIRLYTFTGGEFEESDLLQTATVIPEPSSVALLGLGGLALFMRRRR